MRQQCPNEERIIDYIEGRLPEEDRSKIEKHLSACEMCLEELVITNNVLSRDHNYELSMSPSEVTDAAVRLLTGRPALSTTILIDYANKLFGKLGSYFVNPNRVWPWERWNSAQVRGHKIAANEDYICLEVSFNDVKTTIEIEKTGKNKANIRLRLANPVPIAKSLRVTLKNGEREVASYLLDGNAAFFEDIPFGHYSISVSKDNQTFGDYSFEIKDSDHGGE